MRLPLRSRPLRLAALVALVAVSGLLTLLVAWAPARLDVGPGRTPREVAGVYRVEPTSAGNATAVLSYLRLSRTGEARFETVRLRDDGRRLSAKASAMSAAGRWYVERPSGLAALVRPVRLCVQRGKQRATCDRLDRDAATGDIVLGGPTLLGRAPRQHLVKLRTEGLAL